MNVQQTRRNSASVVVSRCAALEKLKRLIFSPARRSAAVVALAAVLAGASSFAQTSENESLVFDLTVDMTVNEGQTLDISSYVFSINDLQYADKKITLNGGKVVTPAVTASITEDLKSVSWFSYFFGNKKPSDIIYQNTNDIILDEAFNKYRFAQIYGLGGLYFSKDDYAKVCQTGVDTTGTSYFEPLYVHGLDIKSGELEVSYSPIMGINLIETTGDFVKSGWGTLSVGNINQIYYERDSFGNLIYDLNGQCLPQYVVSQDVNSFAGRVDVQNGTLQIQGNADFYGKVTVGGDNVSTASLYALDGTFNFEEDVNVSNGNLLVGHLNGSQVVCKDGTVTFAKDLDVSGYVINGTSYGNIYVYGDVSFNGNINIGGNDKEYKGAHAFFGVDTSSGKSSKFSEDAKVTIEGAYTEVAAEAQGFNVDVVMKGGNLNFYNVSSDNYGMSNVLYVTYDENKVPTYLEWEAARDCIVKATEDGKVLTRSITGKGTIYFTSYQQYTGDITTSANGYTLVFDGGDNTFQGMTIVDSAILALKGGSSYGEISNDKQNYFIISGESYAPVASENGLTTWEVMGCGVLAFYRGDETNPDVAPSVFANSIRLLDGYSYEVEGEVLGGSRLWIDASVPSENSKNVALGSFNANEILIGAQTKVWYDRVSTMKEDVCGVLELNAPVIGIVEDGVPRSASKEEIENIFSGAQLVDATYETDGMGKGTVSVKALNVADYAASNEMTQKERDYAAKLDVNRLTTSSDTAFYDALYNETDAGKVRQTIHNLSIGGYQMLNAYGHFGNPTSSFFGGSTISGEHKRAQSIESNYDPLGEQDRQAEQQSAIANARVDDASRAIWGAYTNTTVDGDEYDNDGITMNGYRLRRQGIVGGLKRQFDGSTSGGLFFGLSNPEIHSNGVVQGDYGNYGSRMEMDDFQFAGHFEKVVGDFWEIAAYVGGGTQTMDWRRDLYLTEGGRYRFEADGAGNTLTGTLYLANRIDLSDAATFRPTIGVDSEHSWLFGFDEIQTFGGTTDEVNAYMRWLAQSYSYDQTYYNRNTARAGARFNWSDSAGIVGINAQAFYAVKLGGKAAPLISYRSESYSFDNMETHAMGNESFSVGGGGFVNLNRKKTLTATGDFNAVWYKNAATQNVTGGLTYRF